MVAGFDDIPEGARAALQLTTVRQPIDRMVEETLAILHLDDPLRRFSGASICQSKARLIWRATFPKAAMRAEEAREAGFEDGCRQESGRTPLFRRFAARRLIAEIEGSRFSALARIAFRAFEWPPR